MFFVRLFETFGGVDWRSVRLIWGVVLGGELAVLQAPVFDGLLRTVLLVGSPLALMPPPVAIPAQCPATLDHGTGYITAHRGHAPSRSPVPNAVAD